MSILTIKDQHIYHEPWIGKCVGNKISLGIPLKLYVILSIRNSGGQLGDPDDATADIEVEEVEEQESHWSD